VQRVSVQLTHGAAPNARLRPEVVRPAQLEPSPPAAAPGTGAGCVKEGTTRKRPRLDWASLQRRTFDADVWRCACGGPRWVLAVITSRRTAEEVLANLGLLEPRAPAARAQAPPQLAPPL
jgi:hypothetical protein